MVYPFFNIFRNREVRQVTCGDFHTLFLIGLPLGLKRQSEAKIGEAWRTEVFGIGENTVGQILGRPSQIQYSEPVLIPALSGKGIEGVWATR